MTPEREGKWFGGGQSSLRQSRETRREVAWLGYTRLPLRGCLWLGHRIAEVVLGPRPILALGLSILNCVQQRGAGLWGSP